LHICAGSLLGWLYAEFDSASNGASFRWGHR